MGVLYLLHIMELVDESIQMKSVILDKEDNRSFSFESNSHPSLPLRRSMLIATMQDLFPQFSLKESEQMLLEILTALDEVWQISGPAFVAGYVNLKREEKRRSNSRARRFP